MAQIENLLTVEIDGVVIDSASDFDANPTGGESKAVIGFGGPLGYTHGVTTYEWKMTIADMVDAEIDFVSWRKNHEEKLITYEKVASGQRFHLRNCVLLSWSEGAMAADGSKPIELSGVALMREED